MNFVLDEQSSHAVQHGFMPICRQVLRSQTMQGRVNLLQSKRLSGTLFINPRAEGLDFYGFIRFLRQIQFHFV